MSTTTTTKRDGIEDVTRALVIFVGTSAVSAASFSSLRSQVMVELDNVLFRRKKKDSNPRVASSYAFADPYMMGPDVPPPQSIDTEEAKAKKEREEAEKRKHPMKKLKDLRLTKAEEKKLRDAAADEVDILPTVAISSPLVMVASFLLVLIGDLIIAAINQDDMEEAAKKASIRGAVVSAATTFIYMMLANFQRPARIRSVLFNSLIVGAAASGLDFIMENALK